MAEDTVGQSAGPATDRKNDPVQDPTENVRALDAAQRLLRETESNHVREILALRSGMAEKISALEQELINEKFAGRDRVQVIKESHRLELKSDGEKQLTAALAAAEKARVEENKSNQLSTDRAVIGMKELIINNAQLSLATTNAMGEKLDDVKNQVGILVNQKIGANEQAATAGAQRQEQRSISGAQVALVSLGSFILLSIITLIVTLLIR